MTTEAETKTKTGPLALIGTILLGAGVALRLLTPAFSGFLHGALPDALLSAGAAAIFLDVGLTRAPRLPLVLLALPLIILPGFFPAESRAWTRGFDFLSICLAGLALRELVLARTLGHCVTRSLLALSFLLGLLGLAQSGFQRAEAREAARLMGHELATSEMGRAFLASDRATATFTNANAFAGFLLLVLPLALVALLAPREDRRPVPTVLFGLVLIAAFFTAGSAGGALALSGGAGILLLHRGEPLSRGLKWTARIGLAVFVGGVVALILALAFEITLPGLEAKVSTFAERIDYHRIGLRLLPDAALLGNGFGSTALTSRAVVRPGESWSAYLHDTPLQLLIEVGPLVLIAFFGFFLTLRRLARATSTPSLDEQPALARAFVVGTCVGAGLAPFLGRTVTLLPLSWENSALDSAIAVAVVLLVYRGMRPQLPSGTSAWLWALGAFALHGFLDFDLYMPGCAMALAILLATAPTQSSGVTAPRALMLVLGLIVMSLPLIQGQYAMRLDQWVHTWEEHASVNVDAPSHQLIESAPSGHWWMLTSLDDTLRSASAHPEKAEALLDSLPARHRELPIVRLAEARWVSRLAILRPSEIDGHRERLESLVRPGERASAEILFRLFTVLQRTRSPETSTVARRALKRADLWVMDETEAPWRTRLEEYLRGR